LRGFGEGGPRELFAAIARAATSRPLVTVLVVAALAGAGLVLALQLEPSSSTDSLVGDSSASAKATQRFHDEFGDESIVVLVKGPLERTVLTEDLGKLIRLEGCLSASPPKDAPELIKATPAPCKKLAALDPNPVKVVYGPGTFIWTAADQINKGYAALQEQARVKAESAGNAARKVAAAKGYSKARQDKLAKSAYQLVYSQFARDAIQLGVRYGIMSVPRPDNIDFVSQLVFDPARGVNEPKTRFAYLFPSSKAAMIQVRLRPNLSDARRKEAVALIRDAVDDPAYKLANKQRYVVSGVPVVVQGLASAVQRSIFVLLGAALLVMAATLLVVFRTRARVRLLPLALALAAAAMTYGSVALAGHELTMASIAALPVLIGLAVDYAIQLHARFDESRASGLEPRAAARAAAARGGPTIAGAALATAAGFLVLLLSPVPMVHGFALLVIVGIALALVCALTAGLATLARFSDPKPRPADLPPVMAGTRARVESVRRRIGDGSSGPFFTSAWLAAMLAFVCVVDLVVAAFVNELPVWIAGGALLLVLAALLLLLDEARAGLRAIARRRGRGALRYAVAKPRTVLAIGLAAALLGWVADTQTEVISDVRQLVPQDLSALRDVSQLEEATGVSGEIDVTVRGADLTSPAAIKWMTDFQERVLREHGYKAGETCRKEGSAKPPDLCPALSLTDLFRQTSGSEKSAKALLAAVPPYFSQAVISKDRQTANLAFGIRLMSLDKQKRVVDGIRRQIDPPAGVTAELAGLPVLAADANAKLASDWRRLLTLVAGLAAVFLVLLLIRRRASAAAIPLIPIALATGWSSAVLWLLQIPLNPMSATLAALVIAISTEFSVLLSARYRQEREAGADPGRALELTYKSTGAAVLASGATAIAGFAAVIASDIRMLHDFGLVTVIDLTVSLLGVMLVLPAALVWAEEHGRFTIGDFDPRRLARLVWRGLRGAPGAAEGAVARLRAPDGPRSRLRPGGLRRRRA
jgi:predicted RND superfamily exporter protein